MEKVSEVIFYTIEKTIKIYRQYAQRQLREAGYKITIDQWLIIKSISENPGITQLELAEIVFKDNASVTRIIELLVKSKYLKRVPIPNDRRRMSLMITKEGKKVIANVKKVVVDYRETALKVINKKEIESMRDTLQKIINNCNPL